MVGAKFAEQEHAATSQAAATPYEADGRWLLLQRILQTPAFVRSPRLAELLSFVCKGLFEGREDELCEQQIGVAVFGRSPNYDSGADTVVRSNALRLRRQLEQYFLQEGREEALRLEIPRGAYVPVFHVAVEVSGTRWEDQSEDPALAMHGGSAAGAGCEPAVFADGEDWPRRLPDGADEGTAGITAAAPSRPKMLVQRLAVYRWALLVALVVCAGLAGALLWLAERGQARAVPQRALLWSVLFTRTQPTRIVLGDSGLVLLHAITHQPVTLDEYLRKDYARQILAAEHADARFASFVTTRRYTSVVDALILSHLLQLPEASPGRTLVQYSRDARLDDFKTGNLILLGAQEANPWVGLFERSMDFVSIDVASTADVSGHYTTFLNRASRAGAARLYNAASPAPPGRTYGLLALEPNLSATGTVLLLEGLNMAGTEAAVDFALDERRMTPLLGRLRRADGSLPAFELLVACDTLTDNAAPARIMALHVHSEVSASRPHPTSNVSASNE